MKATLLSLMTIILVSCSQDSGDPVTQLDPETDGKPAATALPAPGSVDPQSGLIVDENWEVVKAHCGACHSTRLVAQNRGSRETWLSLIRWMQETQGLWTLDPQTEARILTYLTRNYPPVVASRRPPLDSNLLPPDPYQEPAE